MQIGIVSNSDWFIPATQALVQQGLRPAVFYSPPEDAYALQKANYVAGALRISFSIEKDVRKDLYAWIAREKITVLFILGYPQLIDTKKIAGIRAYNVHPGPLPSFRGPSPIFWQLKMETPQLEVCIHELGPQFDKGNVVWSGAVPRKDFLNYRIANDMLSHTSVNGIFFILRLLSIGQLPPPVASRGDNERYQKRPGQQDVTINWPNMTAGTIRALIAACNPWNKGAATVWKGQELKLLDARPGPAHDGIAKPGTVLSCDDSLRVACINGETLRINTVFFMESFIPAYHCAELGLAPGATLG